MTDKQFYTLCGVITLCASAIANSPILGASALFWFLASIAKEK